MLVFLYLQFSLDFARTLHGVRKSYSVLLNEEETRANPTHHRHIEQVSKICTIVSFSFLDQLNIKHIYKHKVWKKFVKKRKRSMEGGIEH